jgi:hypothetical protein
MLERPGPSVAQYIELLRNRYHKVELNFKCLKQTLVFPTYAYAMANRSPYHTLAPIYQELRVIRYMLD